MDDVVIGKINGRKVTADSPEYIDLFEQVTTDSLPAGDYKGRVRCRLQDKQAELRQPYQASLEGLQLAELRDLQPEKPWQIDFLKREITNRLSSFYQKAARKQIPGLTKLMEVTTDPDQKAILESLIKKKEEHKLLNEQAKVDTQNKQEFLRRCRTTPSLKARGWTDGLIKKFLGEPDTTRVNPRYKNAAPMKLYLEDRVEKAEATHEFQEAKAASKVHSEAGKKAAETKARKVMDYVKNLNIDVPEMDFEVLKQKAIDSYNDWQGWADHWMDTQASTSSDEAFLERIMVNFLRHEMSPYENELHEIAGKAGADDARLQLKEKISDAIGDIYPQLICECGRQVCLAYDKSMSQYP